MNKTRLQELKLEDFKLKKCHSMNLYEYDLTDTTLIQLLCYKDHSMYWVIDFYNSEEDKKYVDIRPNVERLRLKCSYVVKTPEECLESLKKDLWNEFISQVKKLQLMNKQLNLGLES